MTDKTGIKILMVDANPRDVSTVRHSLEGGLKGLPYVLDHSVSMTDALARLSRVEYDICIFDYQSGKKDGLDLLRTFQQRGLKTRIIFLIDKRDQEIAEKVIKAGAADYLIKSQLFAELLTHSIRYSTELKKEEGLRRHAEEELRDAFIQNDQLLSSITSILIGIRPGSEISQWNSLAETTFGIKAEKVLGIPIAQCPITWDGSRILEAIADCQKKARPVRVDDLPFTRADKKKGYLGFTINPMRGTRKELSGLLLFGADITKRKEDEEELRLRTEQLRLANAKIEQEKVRYESLLTSIGEGMIAVDPSGKVIMINPQAEEMLGWPKDFGLGKQFHEIVFHENEKGERLPEDQRSHSMSLATGKKVTTVGFYNRKNGSVFPVAITASPIILNGKTIGAIEIFRDITKEKEIDRMKSEFISTVSHELRTPLTSIREGISQVQEGIPGPVNEGQHEFLSLALSELDRLTTIVNDLLDISIIEAGKVELRKRSVDIGELVHRAVTTYQGFAKRKKLTLKSDVPKEKIRVFADPERITQVLTNLISNAYKFTEAGGEITAGVTPEKKEIQVWVRDTGVGLQPEDFKKIFDRFVQVGRTHGPGMKGTGLGLTICKNLIEMHEGRIWVESETGKGSRFIFSLPKSDKN